MCGSGHVDVRKQTMELNGGISNSELTMNDWRDMPEELQKLVEKREFADRRENSPEEQADEERRVARRRKDETTNNEGPQTAEN